MHRSNRSRRAEILSEQSSSGATPAVSVIIPAYNRAAVIGAAIASVLGQSFTDFELIVVDDVSIDGTVAAVEAIGDPRLRVVRRAANGGPGAARNSGVAAARGDIVAFLDTLTDDRVTCEMAPFDHPAIVIANGAKKQGPNGVKQDSDNKGRSKDNNESIPAVGADGRSADGLLCIDQENFLQ